MTTPSRPAHPRLAEVETRLARWFGAAEAHWHERVTSDGVVGWYGSGYTAWAAQANQKYLAAAAALAAHAADPDLREQARHRALAALRHALGTHRVGWFDAEDGRRWGRSWISVLGLERAGTAIDLLADDLDPRHRDLLDAVLIDEADHLADSHERNGHPGIRGGRWDHEGLNWPESNLWNGCHLWRTAQRLPDHPHVEHWRERAVRFLLNAVSVPSDATSTAVVDQRVVGEVHDGANFFDSYALDHHGYLNTGYMVICASNAAIADLDLTAAGQQVPDSLFWHQRDLWQRIRPLISPAGRLIRIGGDSRVRHAYCQEYLLPALLMAERRFGDPDAVRLTDAFLDLVATEQDAAGDGTFYGARMARLRTEQPYYWTRLETDRAMVLGHWWHHQVTGSTVQTPAALPAPDPAWHDPDHGLVSLRGPRRFASTAWRAHSGAQTLVLPIDAADLGEWEQNLAPVLRFEGDGIPASPTESPIAQRRLVHQRTTPVEGGFTAIARYDEGCSLAIAEGWRGGPVAQTLIAVAALPDDATVVGLHLSTAAGLRPAVLSAHGLNLLLADPLDPTVERRIDLVDDCTAVVDDRLTVVADAPIDQVHHGADQGLRSIGVSQLRAGHRQGWAWAGPGSVLVDVAWLVRVGDPDSPRPTLRHLREGQRHLIEVETADGRWQVAIDPDADQIALNVLEPTDPHHHHQGEPTP